MSLILFLPRVLLFFQSCVSFSLFLIHLFPFRCTLVFLGVDYFEPVFINSFFSCIFFFFHNSFQIPSLIFALFNFLFHLLIPSFYSFSVTQFSICRLWINSFIAIDPSQWVECFSFVQETRVQSQVESYQSLYKWYKMLPCFTLSIKR